MLNKIDRSDARPAAVLDEIYDLFIDLDATEDQLDFPVLYTNAKTGVAHRRWTDAGGDDSEESRARRSRPSLSAVPPPSGDPEAVLQVQVTNLDYSDYLGRIAIARVFQGTLHRGDLVGIVKLNGSLQPTRITKLYNFRGLERDEAETVAAGDIVAIAGVEGIQIGETITDPEHPAALEPLRIDEPTLAMIFTVNNFAAFGPRRPVAHLARPARPPGEGTAHQRLDSRGEHRHARSVSRARARRIATGHPDRNDAPRRLRIDGGQTRDRGAHRERQAGRASLEMLVVDCPENYIGIIMEGLGRGEANSSR